ncbi:SDR family NAD(P)-dependent oxidoreductase [Sediminivirga luteola]|uniref:3-oxoacyl-ACP reductase n=1 Tax=Sediminivirga luteola TaxID=1774748 RepID=A0A8J2TW23_9MICO|nr:SDR family NAD(P)-dependent oxidoreductase [Sediminivirga luteola]MCI2264416.1 SDR family oxidoreductase [Sediminivirga luteola]GGA06029.1 3-oxoacyl-ACP reductase [Sediminivirga luteola]
MTGTALITGAARGIGEATARCLAGQGWQVALMDRDPEVIEVAAGLGSQARGYTGDVSDPGDWERIVGAVTADLGPVTGLVSNALITDPTPIDRMTPESWQRQLDVNLTGTFHGVRTCLPGLRAARPGRVVIVSSVHAFFGLPDVPAYAATKAGLTGLTRQLAVQYGSGVRVNCVAPGPIRTAQWDRLTEDEIARSAAETTLGRLGSPDEVAAAIAFLIGDDASFITGATLTVDGGWSVTKNSS